MSTFIKCTPCYLQFDSFNHFYAHLTSVHFVLDNVVGDAYICPFTNASGLTCLSKGFTLLKNFRRHLREFHSHNLDYDYNSRQFSIRENQMEVQVAINRIEVMIALYNINTNICKNLSNF